MSSKTRVGLMGGSFDPIHLGHIAIAREARDALQLSHVLFLPSGRPPHKAHLGASPAQRLEMTRLAVEPLPWAQASDVEVCRQGTIYTVDTLQILSSQHPEAAFYYIIGADTLLDLPNWRNTQKVCTLCRFICLHRPGVADEAIGTALEDLGFPPVRSEGYNEGRWIVMDFSVIIVHLFYEPEREFYHLERLWDDGRNRVPYEKKD